MTEFTMVGNYKGCDVEKCEFYLKESRNIYTIHMIRGSKLEKDIVNVRQNARIRISGVVMKDSEGNDIFTCDKASIKLGGDE